MEPLLDESLDFETVPASRWLGVVSRKDLEYKTRTRENRRLKFLYFLVDLIKPEAEGKA